MWSRDTASSMPAFCDVPPTQATERTSRRPRLPQECPTVSLEQVPRTSEATRFVRVVQGSEVATIDQQSAPRLTSDCHPKYRYGMVITIDSAGRLVVPKPLREQLNLTAGCELEIEAVGDTITLRRASAEPALIRKRGILVHHGTTLTSLDIGDFIRAERDGRAARVGGTRTSSNGLPIASASRPLRPARP